jgi:uncharacterized UBP type Zn finger protein
MNTTTALTVSCIHFDGTTAEPRAEGCEGCGSAFNLRVCTTCGHVGCCESQKGHNTKHSRNTGHPVIKSLPLGEGHFTWCYACRAYLR